VAPSLARDIPARAGPTWPNTVRWRNSRFTLLCSKCCCHRDSYFAWAIPATKPARRLRYCALAAGDAIPPTNACTQAKLGTAAGGALIWPSTLAGFLASPRHIAHHRARARRLASGWARRLIRDGEDLRRQRSRHCLPPELERPTVRFHIPLLASLPARTADEAQMAASLTEISCAATPSEYRRLSRRPGCVTVCGIQFASYLVAGPQVFAPQCGSARLAPPAPRVYGGNKRVFPQSHVDYRFDYRITGSVVVDFAENDVVGREWNPPHNTDPLVSMAMAAPSEKLEKETASTIRTELADVSCLGPLSLEWPVQGNSNRTRCCPPRRCRCV